ncbi:MAG: hypothetical protein GYA42_03910 [Syntrophomonadaceae bacterium]|nr:hypothetical protein [Syntrophomonadaceae bacterium]
MQALHDTTKKLADLKGFHVPVLLKTIEDFEKAGVDEYFLEVERQKLLKLHVLIEELEAKAERLIKRLD